VKILSVGDRLRRDDGVCFYVVQVDSVHTATAQWVLLEEVRK